jgi:hypothetical protein
MVSVANVFILTGPLAGGAVYLATAAFAFDVIYALTRAYIELRRLYDLKKEYQDMLNAEQSRNQYDAIKNHLKFIDERIEFEHVRFGLHVSGTVLTLAAMSLAIPALGISPLLLVTSAAFLLVLWGVMFHLTRTLEHYRPNETLELASSVSKLGFFSSKKSASSKTPSADLDTSLALDAEAKCFETTSCISTI